MGRTLDIGKLFVDQLQALGVGSHDKEIADEVDGLIVQTIEMINERVRKLEIGQRVRNANNSFDGWNIIIKELM